MEESTGVVSVVVSLLIGTLPVIYRLWRRRNSGQDTSETAERRVITHQGNDDDDKRNKETEQDILELAREMSKHQGLPEIDMAGMISWREADLHKHVKRCKKNPGHRQFIPVKDFTMEHLPPDYRDQVIMDWIKGEADLTCRLLSNYTSGSRPQFDPMNPGRSITYPFYHSRGGNCLRTGTGCVSYVNMYSVKDNKNCICAECKRPGTNTPKKVWGEVTILTACHVIHDSDEARDTTCYFFYDTSTTLLHKCPKLTGLKVEYCDIEGDISEMTCVTHDMNLVEKLAKMCDRRLELFEKVRDKYWSNQLDDLYGPDVSYVTDPTPGHVVIISHPHGCSKQITVGEWKQRQTQGEKQMDDENTDLRAEYINSGYRYNAATCPGSSGAPVIRLLEKGRVGWWWLLYSHPHSGGEAGNDNYSGMMGEFVSFPCTSGETAWSLSTLVVLIVGPVAVLGFGCLATGALATVRRGEFYRRVYLCLLTILVLCYFFVPSFGQYRGFLRFALVVYLYTALFSSVVFVVTLVEDFHIMRQVMCGMGRAFASYCRFLWHRLKRRDTKTSYNIQRNLRRPRTRLTKTTTSMQTRTAPPSTTTSSSSATAAAAAAVTTTSAAATVTPKKTIVDLNFGKILCTQYSRNPSPSDDLEPELLRLGGELCLTCPLDEALLDLWQLYQES